MEFFTGVEQHLAVLRGVVGGEVEAGSLPSMVVGASNGDAVRLIEECTSIIEAVGSLRIAASGALAARSRREQGHEGLAAGEGHRSAVSLVQELTGTTRTEAAKQVRLGESLLNGANLLGSAGAPVQKGADAAPSPRPPEPWHAWLGRAKLAGKVTADQHHAILRGLGDPTTGTPAVDAEFAEAWGMAAEQLADEAAHRAVDELAASARTIRDRLDPRGAQERFHARFEGRSFRLWKDAHGVSHARVVFDDESAAFVTSVIDSAMRPRRGGPRFVDAEEKAHAEVLSADPRSNEQLEFDLIFDVLRAGALAEAKAVFGTRQAGVRIVVADHSFAAALDGRPAVAHTEDGVVAVPASLAAQRACDTGTRTIWIDGGGEPLRLGRDERLFSAAQRLAMAARDGGCRGPNCDRPPAMCEAHHIDKYSEGGRTDVDRGMPREAKRTYVYETEGAGHGGKTEDGAGGGSAGGVVRADQQRSGRAGEGRRQAGERLPRPRGRARVDGRAGVPRERYVGV